MKIKYAIAAALMISISAFAQKDELKALKKLSDREKQPTAADIAEFKQLLDKAEPLMGNATPEQQIDFYYYKGSFALVSAMMNPAAAKGYVDSAVENLNKVVDMEKTAKKKLYTKEIQEEIYPEMKSIILTQAQTLGKQSKFKEAYPMYEMAYKVYPKDTLNLFNAAAYAVNAQDYDAALRNFIELERLGFTGTSINYTGKNAATGQIEYYGDKKTRDLLVTQKQLTEPGIYREPSKKSDIVKNIALIYLHKGDKENAMKAIERAKKANPGDVSMLSAEAQIYLESKDYDNYKKAVKQILDQGSKDPNLYFNLGVTTSKSAGQEAEAEQYYLKAIELNPQFVNAYLNLGILQLNGEDKLVEEMNNLGTSAKELKRYEVVKKQRDDKYRASLKYIEKAYQIDPKNEDVKTLLGVLYQGLDMEAEYKALKAKK